MPRSLWNGTIAFALVHVPVKLYSAVEDKTVHFHEVHLEDGGKIEHRRFCSKEEKEVPYEEVVKGYEVSDGEFVVLSKDEVKAAAGSRAKVIDIEHFVPAEDIDPVFYEQTYVVGPRDEGADAYRLLHAALKRTGRAGVGRFVFHDRERLVALRPLGKVLGLGVLRFADELVDGGDLDLPKLQKKPAEREVAMAGQLVEGMHEDFKPSKYKDTYRQAVLALIEAKAKGEDAPTPDEAPPEDHDDLLAALEASLEGAKGSKPKTKKKAKTASKKKAAA